MKAYLIDPEALEIVQTEIEDWRGINDAIGSRCFTVATILPNGDTLYVDDEGLFKEDQSFFTFADYPQPLAGRGLLLGGDDSNGESRDVQTAKIDVSLMTRFVTVHFNQ